MRPSVKRTILIFANFNTIAFFIAFVIVAGAFPPCWKKDGTGGPGYIGAPADTGFSGTHPARPPCAKDGPSTLWLTVSTPAYVRLPLRSRARAGTAGSNNIGSWGPDPGWYICLVTFLVVCLPYTATSLGIYFRSDARDAPIPERRPRAKATEMSSPSSVDYRSSVAM